MTLDFTTPELLTLLDVLILGSEYFTTLYAHPEDDVDADTVKYQLATCRELRAKVLKAIRKEVEA